MACPHSCAFFSDYMEAADGSENHYIEIFNGCGPIQLRDYQLLTCRDGCEMARPGAFDSRGAPHGSLRINLPDRTVPHKGMFVIACAPPCHPALPLTVAQGCP